MVLGSTILWRFVGGQTAEMPNSQIRLVTATLPITGLRASSGFRTVSSGEHFGCYAPPGF